ncbi:hypothetical protein PspLS_02514 [Pyricularia sp. CBS 133598]|nr:hypothetical protein PspLS_02514 [Pyricularia sp. CBS 133598]
MFNKNVVWFDAEDVPLRLRELKVVKMLVLLCARVVPLPADIVEFNDVEFKAEWRDVSLPTGTAPAVAKSARRAVAERYIFVICGLFHHGPVTYSLFLGCQGRESRRARSMTWKVCEGHHKVRQSDLLDLEFCHDDTLSDLKPLPLVV